MFNSVFTPEWWCVKWMATTALKAKTLKFQYIKLDKTQKMNCFTTRSVTQYLRRASRDWWKETKVIISRLFLSTAECYMIIANILNTINLEEQ